MDGLGIYEKSEVAMGQKNCPPKKAAGFEKMFPFAILWQKGSGLPFCHSHVFIPEILP